MDSIIDTDLVQPRRCSNGTYENPFVEFEGLPAGGKLCRFLGDRMKAAFSGPPKPTTSELERELPVLKPNAEQLRAPPADKIQYVWIGHATVLYQVEGWNILSDPIWSGRCSPISFVGPKRYRPPPLSIGELPRIDAVVISHNHYDHLDLQSVQDLNAKFGTDLHWFVPVGLAGWLEARGCETVTELSWWQTSSEISEDGRPPLRITCTPAQHWSLRSGFDRNQSLWSSWVIRTPKHSIWFSGDTGYCNVFKTIGKEYGPFDLSAIAIGAYCPRYFMTNQHVDPAEALQIHEDLDSKLSVGIHWGTFPMGSTEPYLEPRDLIAELQKNSGKSPTFITVHHGSINIIDQ